MKKYLLLIPLFVLAFASLTVLGYQWLSLIVQDSANIIQLDPLQEENVEVFYMSDTSSLTTQNSAGSSLEQENSSQSSSSYTYTTDNGEFTVTSDDTLWEQYTSVNIFGGLEIIAPGDSGEFYFTLSNGKDSSIDYTMTIEKFEHETLLIPLTFRLKTAEGNYVGSDEWISGDELEKVVSSISANNNLSYILQWQWDAYVDDEYDTLLGTSEKLEYTMNIIITASGDGDSMNLPQTGDTGINKILIIMSLLSFIMVIIILIKKKKEQTNS